MNGEWFLTHTHLEIVAAAVLEHDDGEHDAEEEHSGLEGRVVEVQWAAHGPG